MKKKTAIISTYSSETIFTTCYDYEAWSHAWPHCKLHDIIVLLTVSNRRWYKPTHRNKKVCNDCKWFEIYSHLGQYIFTMYQNATLLLYSSFAVDCFAVNWKEMTTNKNGCYHKKPVINTSQYRLLAFMSSFVLVFCTQNSFKTIFMIVTMMKGGKIYSSLDSYRFSK